MTMTILRIVFFTIAIIATLALALISKDFIRNTQPSEYLLTRSSKGSVTSHCPVIDIRKCSQWNEIHDMSIPNKRKEWRFNNSDCEIEESMHQEVIYIIPNGPSIVRGLDTISKNKTSIVFYGSSHIRELHLAFVRLKRGLHYMDNLETNLTNVPSGMGKAVNPLWQVCDPFQSGWRDGNYGVDLDACGLPGKRLVPELGKNIAIGFKTFLHTPAADQVFVDWLQDVDLRHPQVLIADVGIWGTRGHKTTETLNYILTPEEEIQYYINWLCETFPTTKLVLVLGGSDPKIAVNVERELLLLARQNQNVHLLRKDIVMKQKPNLLECEHGCKGPVLAVLAMILLDWLQVAMDSPIKCLQ